MKAIFAAWALLAAASSVPAQPTMPVGTLTAGVATPGKAPTMTCQKLASLQLSGIKVSSAAESARSPDDGPMALPVHCVVSASLKPNRGGNRAMELWMPINGWNGKLIMIGNTAQDGGSIPHAELVDSLRRGYAVVASDNRPTGPGDKNPAVHDTVEKAKALTVAFYGAAPRYSYWTGNAFGGTRGLEEARMYPGDFDGLIVGALTNDWMRDAAAADLAAFKARGGKIIQYQICADAAIAPQSSGYFERVAAAQGGLGKTEFFYRLFVIPAPEHANGTYSFDWIATLEEWVEEGRAPDSVLANHIPPPDAALKQPAPGALVFEPAYGIRVMCAYPRVARLQAGMGEVPVDWICQPAN